MQNVEPAGRVVERDRAQEALSEVAGQRDRSLLALSARIASAANEADSPAGGYLRVLEQLCVYTGWPVGHVLRREGDLLHSTGAWWMSDEQRFGALREGDLEREHVAAGCLAEVLARAEPAVVSRISPHTNPRRFAVMQGCGLVGHVVLPVLAGREVVAVLEFMSHDPMQPDPSLLEVLRQAGVQLGRVVERARSHAALGLHAAKLAASNAELERFAYVASHDLQEPLRMVSNYAQLLERHCEGQLDDSARRYLGYMVEGATRMQALINGLLQISRVGAQEEPPRAVDLNALMRTLRRELAALLAERRVELQVAPLPVVLGQPEQIAQVLQNLIGNAIKFVEPGQAPRVQVSAEPHERMWCVAVRDNGIGIDGRHAERIFRIFERLHPRRAYPGTGIGLTLCHKLVERHGGRIWFESCPGEGTTFLFTLPAAA